ncbi:MAG: hypothetical protein IV105_15145 [Rhizobacter sp.]|nr:hypothetical protein [Rhizobacter sp.]
MCPPLHARLLLIGAIWTAACTAVLAQPTPEVEPPTEPASAPEATPPAEPAPAETPSSEISKRIETTLDSWQEFLDELLIDALGPDPERRYRVFGKRKTVDLGKRWTLALDERQTGRLDYTGVGIPAAGQPARTWEILHNGRRSQWRFYNQLDGSGRENGGSLVTTLAPGWSIHTQGRHLNDDTVGVVRTDAQTGLRFGSYELWVEGFARHARLEDTELREGWSDPKPRANFAGLQTQWEALPGLTFAAQHQRAIKPDMAPGDERLADARTEFGADYRPGSQWSGSRIYWREATHLGLLSSAGVEERTTYKRVVGAEVPEGSPDGLVYAQIRHQSLVDDRDALLVLGWRHTTDLAPQWRAQSLIETGIPIGGDNAVKSNTVDLRVSHNAFPQRVLLTELQTVRTPIRNSAFASVDFTERLTQNSLLVTRVSVTGVQPNEQPDEVPVNSGSLTLGWGWQEPEERHLSTFWRYTGLARNAIPAGVVQPGVADRRAHIGAGEINWQLNDKSDWLLRAARRYDRDQSFNAGEVRTTTLTLLRPIHQIAERWRLSVHAARLVDSHLPSQTGYGAELSVRMNRRLVLALGYNPRGIDDGELAGDERLGKGVKLRLYIPTEAVLTHWLKPR